MRGKNAYSGQWQDVREADGRAKELHERDKAGCLGDELGGVDVLRLACHDLYSSN